MTDATQGMAEVRHDARPIERLLSGPRPSFETGNALVGRRYRREARFRALGLGAIMVAMSLLGLLLFSVAKQGYRAFWQTSITLDITLPQDEIDPDKTGDPAIIGKADFQGFINDTLHRTFPEVEGRREKKALRGLVSSGAGLKLRDAVMSDPAMIGGTHAISVLASDDIDQLVKGAIDRRLAEDDRRVKDREIAWVDALDAQGRVETRFNTVLFTSGDSREPELAGIWGAVVGSFYMMLVTLLLAVPIGVAAATYLEEFAPKTRLTDFIEVNINNLAAVPSIVFGLLGLAVFLQVFHLPRSAPLVGGLTLSLMTLPTVVVATRAALRSVPPSIREAALGMGASKVQTVAHHVLPLALPGILTGSIIGMAQALGETAPLLMIGMVAFIVDIPSTPLDPATALPVQIYLWADSPERAFTERTAAAIMVLLAFLILMNALAVFLRRKFERKW
ncbi:MAG: phosphate ABC transporter permease PstA [Geminicoccaceae bacterium]